jgi:hypothetical protein
MPGRTARIVQNLQLKGYSMPGTSIPSAVSPGPQDTGQGRFALPLAHPDARCLLIIDMVSP